MLGRSYSTTGSWCRKFIYIGLVMAGTGSPALPQSVPWDVTFRGNADADGGVIEGVFRYDGNIGAVQFAYSFNVPAGSEPPEKAVLFRDAIIAAGNPPVTFTFDESNYPPDYVVKVTPAAGIQITVLEINDVSTGEDPHSVKDDPAGIFVDIEIDIEGIGVNRADSGVAEAVLGIGSEALATVLTLGMTGDEIETELMTEFNALYAPDYEAILENGSLLVRDVPCELGTTFGTDDNGLSYGHRTALVTPPIVFIPTLSQSALALMALFLLSCGAVVINRRRRSI